MRISPKITLALTGGLLLAACQTQNGPGAPGDSPEGFGGIGAEEKIEFIGTEPFWGGSTQGDSLTYTTPERIEGTTIEVKRFTGNGGLGLSGTLDGKPFDMTVTPGTCSDAMSDRSYPFTVTLRIGTDTRLGCAWTQSQPFEGAANP
ncbi:MAG: hypothetical protein GW855_13465 [Erythrobacter sp.]|nr:hypothetical protein [Erythrobacter sp.]NCQ64979.1 hypothetical protein [Alphaproteobacteria bacterium]